MGPVTALRGRGSEWARPGNGLPRRSGSKQEQTSRQICRDSRSGSKRANVLAVALGVLLHLVAMVGDQPMGFLVYARGLPPTGQLRPVAGGDPSDDE
jgi:hypothetical protein